VTIILTANLSAEKVPAKATRQLSALYSTKLRRNMDNTPKKQRIQFDFTVESFQRLEELQAKMDAPTKAEVMRHALKICDLFVTEFGSGYTIEVRDSDGNVVLKGPTKILTSYPR
jgi:hypothetical protein